MTQCTHHNNDDGYIPVGEFVHIFLRKNNPIWHVYYRYEGKTVRKSLKTTKKKQARALALAMERDLLAGKSLEPHEAPLIGDAINEYIAHLIGRKRTSKTLSKYQHCFKLVQEIATRLRVERLDQVDLRFIDAFRNERTKNSSPKTVLNDLVTIRQLINFALQRKLLREDPLAGVKFDKPRHTPQPYWSREETVLVVDSANDYYRPLYHFLAETGARVSEGVWLTWEDIDFKAGVIRIRAKGSWKPKTGDERVIPISPPLRRMLLNLPRTGRWVFTARPTEKHPQLDRQICDRRSLDHLKRVLKKVGLQGHHHTFRHSFITHALISGTPAEIVRNWVGHVDQKIMDRYTHIADQISQQAMTKLYGHENEEESTETDPSSGQT